MGINDRVKFHLHREMFEAGHETDKDRMLEMAFEYIDTLEKDIEQLKEEKEELLFNEGVKKDA